MKRVFLCFSLLCFGFFINAQPVLELKTKEHDFGKFKEEAGRQQYDFVVTNTGNAPLVIQNITATCGCTTPEWTRQPIPAGGKGVITALYDPRNRPGAFNKTLTVFSNAKPGTVRLIIKGEVIPREKTVEELYTFAVGNVRFESNHLAFTNIKKTGKKIRVMKVINTSTTDPATVTFEQVPEFVTLKISPATLKPGQKGTVEGTYDATKNDKWGHESCLIRVAVNGEIQKNKYYYVSANLVEDFSSLSKEELENAPTFTLETKKVDLGKMKNSTSKEVEFKFTNTGKSDLIIRHIKSTCGCTAIDTGIKGVGIKPGESNSIKASFNSGSYKGKVTKAIYVYTNDPKNSEVVLMLTAEVEQENKN